MGSETGGSDKRVSLFGSINWRGDSIHQSLNITGKPIAKKYCEGKLKRTLKKEWKELERVLWERIIHEKGCWIGNNEAVRWRGSMMANWIWWRDCCLGGILEQEICFIIEVTDSSGRGERFSRLRDCWTYRPSYIIECIGGDGFATSESELPGFWCSGLSTRLETRTKESNMDANVNGWKPTHAAKTNNYENLTV